MSETKSERNAKIVRQYLSGKSTPQLSEEHKISYQRVHQILRHAKIKMRNNSEVAPRCNSRPHKQRACARCTRAFFSTSRMVDGRRVVSSDRLCAYCDSPEGRESRKQAAYGKVLATLDQPRSANEVARMIGIHHLTAQQLISEMWDLDLVRLHHTRGIINLHKFFVRADKNDKSV